MLTDAAKAQVDSFKARKLAQWEKVASRGGLQMIRSGEQGTQFVAPGIVMHGITNLRMESVQGFTGAGVQALTGIWVGGSAAVPSNDVQVSDCRVDGPLNVTNCQQSGFEGRVWGGVQTDGSAVDCVFSIN